jgi:hypothetical protein
VKIENAKKHLRTLELGAADYRNRTEMIWGATADPNVPWTKHVPVIPFDVLAGAGDVIQNLRSALDHLAFQLVMVGTNDVGPANPSRIQFPIHRDRGTYDSNKSARTEGMREDAKLAIDAAKPYKGGNEALWRIHELNNIDKHRMLFTVAGDHVFTAEWIRSMGEHWTDRISLHGDEAEFAALFGNGAEKEVQGEIEDAFAEVADVRGDALFPTLRELVEFTEGFVTSFLFFLE